MKSQQVQGSGDSGGGGDGGGGGGGDGGSSSSRKLTVASDVTAAKAKGS
jgi:hypothetical protein